MNSNIIVETIEKVIKGDYITHICGTFQGVGTNKCALIGDRGCVYGIAVKIEKGTDIKTIIDDIDKANKRISKVDDWKPLGKTDYYPLYWGKDINMGLRLHSHTRSSKSTGTIQLDKLKSLENLEVIYGAVPCNNRAKHEKELQKRYKCLLKTLKTE